jgi:hypothetical protein
VEKWQEILKIVDIGDQKAENRDFNAKTEKVRPQDFIVEGPTQKEFEMVEFSEVLKKTPLLSHV